jgi:uncharacterized SAM-binding protein YcdF (DUF218 family)
METFKELLTPSNACLLLAAMGGLAFAVPAMRLAARWMLTAASLLLLTLASGWTATALLTPLERANTTAIVRDGDPAARAIVVLGAFGIPEPDVPLSSWPNDAGLFRVVEAIHLRERCRDCRVFVSGSTPTVDAMAKVLVSLGVSPMDVGIEGRSDTTVASARNMEGRLRGAPFYLVTSAGHMPRALLAFRALGLNPLPAPTDFRAQRDLAFANPWPNPHSLMLSDLAIHEYLGLLWYRLQGM